MSVLLELAFFLALVCQVPVESYVSIKVPSGPSSTLESYLCNGSLRSNVLYSLTPENTGYIPVLSVQFFNVSAIALQERASRPLLFVVTTKKPRGFGFLSVRNVTIEKVKDMRFEPSTSGLGFIGAGITILEQRSVIVDGCQFKHLEAPIGAAVSAKSASVLVVNSTFEKNIGYKTGAICSNGSTVELMNSSFTANVINGTGEAGAIYVYLSKIKHLVVVDVCTQPCSNWSCYIAGDFVERNGSATYSLSLVNTVVKDNRCSCGMQDQTKGAAIYTSELSYLSIEGGEFTGNSPRGAIQVLAGRVHIKGNVTFRRNTGENGGALCLSNNALLYFYSKTNVKFLKTGATGIGGALYIQGDPNTVKSDYIGCAINFPGDDENFTIVFNNNTAQFLIFYANIVQVNAFIFFNQTYLQPLQIIISFINLDLGFPLCFYDGMDDAAKTGLQFVFPAYLLVLTIAFIVLCHYCLKSNFSGKRLNRFSRFVGKRAVSVLATLIYLSYSKLLRTVIQILTFATVHIDKDKEFRVWFYDGTIRYLEGKHLLLFLIAMVTSVFFLFPYTLALTLIPIIDKYSDHNRLSLGSIRNPISSNL
eukprot:Em0070g2a